MRNERPLDHHTLTVVLNELCARQKVWAKDKVRGLQGLVMAIRYLRHEQMKIENSARERQRRFDETFQQRRLEGV